VGGGARCCCECRTVELDAMRVKNFSSGKTAGPLKAEFEIKQSQGLLEQRGTARSGGHGVKLGVHRQQTKQQDGGVACHRKIAGRGTSIQEKEGRGRLK